MMYAVLYGIFFVFKNTVCLKSVDINFVNLWIVNELNFLIVYVMPCIPVLFRYVKMG